MGSRKPRGLRPSLREVSVFGGGEVFLLLLAAGHLPLLGDYSVGVPPVPIPNTEVKPYSPDGTARASGWESRKLPD